MCPERKNMIWVKKLVSTPTDLENEYLLKLQKNRPKNSGDF